MTHNIWIINVFSLRGFIVSSLWGLYLCPSCFFGLGLNDVSLGIRPPTQYSVESALRAHSSFADCFPSPGLQHFNVKKSDKNLNLGLSDKFSLKVVYWAKKFSDLSDVALSRQRCAQMAWTQKAQKGWLTCLVKYFNYIYLKISIYDIN